MEISMDYIRSQLQRRAAERQLSAVAAGSKVHLRTLQRMVNGHGGRIENAEKVQKFLRDTEREKKLSKEPA